MEKNLTILKGLEFFNYYEPIKQRVVLVNEKYVFSVPCNETDNYRCKLIFSIKEFNQMMEKQTEFENELNNMKKNNEEREKILINENLKELEKNNFKKTISTFSINPLETGKTFKALEKKHLFNGELNSLKNHIEKYVEDIESVENVLIRDIDGKPYFTINNSTFSPLANRSGEKYFKYLLTLK